MTTPLPSSWENDVLTAINAPVTPNNILNLDLWQHVEGGSTNNPDAFNPFNTTLPAPGSHPTNSVGVQSFPDWATGVRATSQTLEQNNMRDILAALRGDVPMQQFKAAVNSDPWGTHFGKETIVSGPGSAVGAIAGSAANSFGQGASAVGGAVGDAVGALNPGNVLSSFLKDIITNGLVMRGTLIVVGLVILFIGLSQVTKGSSSAAQTVAGGTSSVVERTSRTATKVRSNGKDAALAATA